MKWAIYNNSNSNNYNNKYTFHESNKEDDKHRRSRWSRVVFLPYFLLNNSNNYMSNNNKSWHITRQNVNILDVWAIYIYILHEMWMNECLNVCLFVCLNVCKRRIGGEMLKYLLLYNLHLHTRKHSNKLWIIVWNESHKL